MTLWILVLVLATGETGPVPVDQRVCLMVPEALARNELITVEREDGSNVQVIAAVCAAPEEDFTEATGAGS